MEQPKFRASAAHCYKRGIQKALYLCTGFCVATLILWFFHSEWQWFVGYVAGTLFLFALFTSAEGRYKTVGVLGRKIAYRVETERAVYKETTWEFPETIIASARNEGVTMFAFIFFFCSAVVWMLCAIYGYFF
jgi:hypothetical protein